MGLASNVMEGLVRESRHRPFVGTAYTLGRQTMAVSPAKVNAMFQRLGAQPVGEYASDDDIDTITTFSGQLPYPPVKDTVFFRMLGFTEQKAIDVSNFEGAEIILDLNSEIPSELLETADLVVDGSTFDNVFDPAAALRNSVRLLKPNGRICIVKRRRIKTITAAMRIGVSLRTSRSPTTSAATRTSIAIWTTS
jgi:SAM-dependent methyltransferase